MNLLAKLLMLTIMISGVQSAFAFNKFFCQCKAKAPGFEETNRQTGGIDKICSYSCNCMAWEVKTKANGEQVATSAVSNQKLDVINVPTTAYSREEWDAGSHICHGQYSYRQNLSDPNWKIKVKFDTFGLNDAGDVIYDEEARREIAQGVGHVGFKYTKKAKEISSNLAEQLKNRK